VGQDGGRSFEEFFAATYGRLVGLVFAFLHYRAQARTRSRTPSPARRCAGRSGSPSRPQPAMSTLPPNARASRHRAARSTATATNGG
jgi:hypothetical protein